MSSEPRFLRALKRQPVDRTPIWMMRQAGRYLPEYRKVRQTAGSFLDLCQNPDFAAEVTLQPIDRFGFDASIIFSDILVIPYAMGMELKFVAGEGPVFPTPLQTDKDILNLPATDVNHNLEYVFSAIKKVKAKLPTEVPLIGFCGSPWTVATYMIEGGSTKQFAKIKKWAFANTDSFMQLMDKLADNSYAYLREQVRAGADCLMIFDSWGGVLSPEDYQKFSLAPMQRMVSKLKADLITKDIPIIMFTKGGGQWLEAQADIGVDGLGLDWTTNIGAARKRVGHKVALQGNLDPSILYASPDIVAARASKILHDFGPNPGHIFNLGHGIHPDAPPEHVQALVETVQQFKL